MKNKFSFEILNKIDLGILVLNKQQEIVFWNQFLVDLTAKEFLDVKGRKITDIYPMFKKNIYQSFFADVLKEGQSVFCSGVLHDLFIQDKMGADIKQNMLLELISIGDDNFILMQIFDITDQAERVRSLKKEIRKRKEAEQKLKFKTEQQELLLNNIEIQVWYLKDEKTYGLVNKNRAKFLGFDKSELEGEKIAKVHNGDIKSAILESNKEVFDKKEKMKWEEWSENSEGEKRLLLITKTPKLNKEEEIEYVFCSAEDITDRKKKAEKIRYLSFHDSLTKLYNRAYYEMQLEELNKVEKLPLSIILADVNGLKLTNDVFGHKAGDELLKEIAKLLKSSIREDDILARWGGDEFAILLPKTDFETAKQIVKRIKNKCQNSDFTIVPPSLAIAAAVKKNEEQDIESVFKEAESKMYETKEKQKQGFDNPLLNNLIKRRDSKEYKMIKHSSDLTTNIRKMGEILALDEHDIKKLILLGELHDIGKLAIEQEVLEKKSELTKAEWNEFKTHVKKGSQIASAFPVAKSLADAILHHHERWDGNGYPDGLAKDNIPYLARILAVVDMFDSLTSDIYYPVSNDLYFAEPLDEDEASKKLRDFSGSLLDPNLTEVFLEQLISAKSG